MKRWLAVMVSLLLSVHAAGTELFEDGKFVAEAVRGYQMQLGDTLGGYILYRPESSTLARTDVTSTTGGDMSLRMPFVTQVYAPEGKWQAVQTTMVTLGSNSTRGWSGDPCGGEHIAKINRIRGHLDRCAIARFKPLDLAGGSQTVLELNFVETNSGGRYYELNFLINLVGLGVPVDVVADEKTVQHLALKAWMADMLNAVVVAAGYNKPANAFDGVAAPWKVILQ